MDGGGKANERPNGSRVPAVWPLQTEREFWRHACTPGTSPHSLWWFVRIAWGTEWYFKKTGKTRWLVERVHKPWLAWYEKHAMAWFAQRRRGEIGRTYLLTLATRNFGKTLLLTRAANLWAHVYDRNYASYIGSETHPKAKVFLSSIKAVMEGKDENAWFSWLYGNFYKSGTWSGEAVTTAYRSATSIQEPTFGTYGLEMGITGMHPDAVTFDDPTSLETMTEATLQAARDSYDATHPALRTDSLFSGVMTRYAGNDAAGHILSQEGVATWSGLPCPDPRIVKTIGKGKVHVYFLQGRDVSRKTEEHPKGTPVLPEVWDKAGMDHYEDKDPVNFAAQIQNDPTVGEHMPLELAQLERMLISRQMLEEIPIDFVSIHLDTAFKDEQQIARGDYNVAVGVLHDMRPNGRVYIDKIIWNKKDRAEQFLARLTALLMSYRDRGLRVKIITADMEQGGTKGTLKQLIQVTLSMAGFQVGPDVIVQYNRTNKKPVRLRKAAAYWAQGYVRILSGIEHQDRLMYEMVNLDKSDHDDIADALSDIWQPEVWTRPYRERGNESETPIQPGDEGLRPGLVPGANRFERRAQYDSRYGAGSEPSNDPV
jgi:hypothetical protein